ncbi:MAG: hypothetical protein WC845_01630 [Candidatus Staskawiczbacteria bacterium]|jgi:hypothetical protein
MNQEEIEKLLLSKPDEVIASYEKKGIDFESTKKTIDAARLLVREKYKMTQENIDAVEFCFWFTYFVEREVDDLVVCPETMAGARKEAMNAIIDHLHFGDKISLISELHIKEQKRTHL